MIYLPAGAAGFKPLIASRIDIVCSALETLPPQPDTAAQVHVAAAEALRRAGFDVVVEFRVDGGGRIDIVAMRDSWSCAIEIDARRPRARSLLKLRNFVGARVIALRGVTALLPAGIDAVATIPVRTALRSEIDDRRVAGRLRK